MITLQCLLRFERAEDREAVHALMRRFSAAVRHAYQRLLEEKEDGEILKGLSSRFSLNARYAYGALVRAKTILSSCKERGQNPRKVVFGGRGLFEQLRRGHLAGKRRVELRQAWRERRQGLLFAVGQKHSRGD